MLRCGTTRLLYALNASWLVTNVLLAAYLPQSIYDKGNRHFLRDECDRARLCYSTVATLRPSWSKAHFMLGRVYDVRGAMDLAKAEYERAVRLQELPIYLNNLATIHIALHEFDPAERRLGRAISLNSGSAATKAQRTLYYLTRKNRAWLTYERAKTSRWDESSLASALTDLDVAMLVHPTMAGAHCLWARIATDLQAVPPEIVRAAGVTQDRLKRECLSCAALTASYDPAACSRPEFIERRWVEAAQSHLNSSERGRKSSQRQEVAP